ncbi:MAG: hypothetical protein M9899_10595 [Bdellovibrionaceae bacterium]|nr:hypothetical protein [Pseudobdellovibrionaceae bacterium]
MNANKHYEFSLKLFVTLAIAAAAFVMSWSSFIFALFALTVFWGLYSRNSTRWLLRTLDLGPESEENDLLSLTQQAQHLAQKYGISTPKIYRIQHPLPVVLGLGSARSPILVVSAHFFDKLSPSERLALLEVAIYKIECNFTRYTEFITLFNLALIEIGSKMDFLIVLITGIKNKKNHNRRNYILFSRLFAILIYTINSIYVRTSFFLKVDEAVYHNNPSLLLALKKTELYTPTEFKSMEPLLSPFNFSNFATQSNLEKRFQKQPSLKQRVEFLQKDKNLMMESLTFS